MEAKSPERLLPFNLNLVFRRGLGRQLLLFGLGLAMVPMALVAWLSYQTAHQRLDHEVRQNIRIVAELKSRQLQRFVDDRLAEADKQGRQRTTLSFFNTLVRRHAAAEETVSEFVSSVPWAMATSAFGADMELHANLYGYSDILVVDPVGNILFSSARHKDLAENLNQGGLAKTRFAEAFRRTLDSGNPSFAGFERYSPAGDTEMAFVTAPIRGENSPPAGVIAFQIPLSTVQPMVEAPVGLGTGSQMYLVDSDLTMLAGATGSPHLYTGVRVDTAQTRLWRKNQSDDGFPSSAEEPFAYAGPAGNPVIGTHAQIRLGNTLYALIVEMETAAAFGAIHPLRAAIFTIVILTGVGALVLSAILARSILEPVRDLSRHASMVQQGHFDHDMHVAASHEIGELAASFNSMIQHLKTQNSTLSRFISGLANLHRLVGDGQTLAELSLASLEFLCDFLDLCQADFFIMDDQGELKCISRFPGHPDGEGQPIFDAKDGWIGQADQLKTITIFHKEPINGLVSPVSEPDLANLIAAPLMWRQTVKGVLVLMKTGVFSRPDYHFVEAAAPVIAVAVDAASTRQQEEALLEQTRKQAQRLKAREASLEESTHQMQLQSRAFQASEEKLQFKQMELEAANAQMVKNAGDLEAHMAILEKQKLDMEKQNTELEKTHLELAEKARQLEISSRYKTEFMANMSHELRTPLNSILLLSRLLLENKENNLTTRQFEFAQTIHSAGEDLLNLINEILDLAKVESGKMEVELQAVWVQSIADAIQVSFAPLAEQRGIRFTIRVASDVPERLITDRKRVEQIIKNFLSNAFKFTARGTIHLEFTVSRELVICRGADDAGDHGCLAISVVDTGIGIPAAKQQMVFEAFQQVDGSTRRKYGGTGLGLSISRELARMLGGIITLESEDEQGSRFTLHLPIIPLPENEPAVIRTDPFGRSATQAAASPSSTGETESTPGVDPVPDDRHRLAPGDRCILIIDPDPGTTETIKDQAYLKGYKVLVAEQFQTGLHFADYYLPAAIFLNLGLTDAHGWTMVHRIKANPGSRHIPVFTFALPADDFHAAVHGAAGHVNDPVTPLQLEAAFQRIHHLQSTQDRTILVVAPDPDAAGQITDAVGGKTIHIMAAATAAEAKTALKTGVAHAVILHPALDAAEQHGFLTAMRNDPMPVFLYPGASLDIQPAGGVEPFSAVVNLEAIDAPDRLLQALVSRLHLLPDALEAPHRDRLLAADNRLSGLKGRKVLLVDDDMRTVFAVSNVLEDQGAEVFTGKSGKESLDKLDGFPDIDLVLMDVMIADVDGYQAIREIRRRDRFKALPIVALTAKAMQGDRSKCIAAGADDYLAKPVNLDKLTSMLKIWMAPH
ncbi:response regulator [Desulfosarcina sp.]|uniref:response regulator n=1 Tax=Desulfosarcina sp. TaxID=2027861 RepID=UPI003562ACCD